ncbi:MAG TPA: hypothetical protein VM778_04955 [Gemmatimonadota bacterium]|nr:hypothetical protein [Gemmatimonadota bacterium]
MKKISTLGVGHLTWSAAALASVAACATAGEATRDELGREVVTLAEGDLRWVDDERLSVFLHSVDPALELAAVYLKPHDGEQETWSMSTDNNRVVDFADWRIELIELPGPDSATLAIRRLTN